MNIRQGRSALTESLRLAPAAAFAGFLPSPERRRIAAVGSVALIHLAVLWAFAISVHPPHVLVTNTEMQIDVLSPNLMQRVAPAPPLDWTFDTPKNVVVSEPEFTIAPDGQGDVAVAATAPGQMLAPRPDPHHANLPPDLPAELRAFAKAAMPVLRIHIMTDGSVADAQLAKSSGQHDIDMLALSYVKANWRFIPAMAGGKTLDSWTTVYVRFLSSS
jgi:TonB family protein